MVFLKEILGDELFNQFEEKINAYNGDEANKDNPIKIANLGSGEYVGKGKHESEIEKVNNLLNGRTSELEKANELIAELKKGTKGNDDLQSKITGYESQVTELQAELAETKLKSALKVALLSEKATDVPYMTFKIEEKLKEQGKTLELDENENIKGWDDVISGMKTQFPTMFEGSSTRKIDPNPLQKPDPNGGAMTKVDFLKKPYADRLAFANENPEAYKEMMGHK